MPKKSFPLEEDSKQQVQIEWKGVWKDFTVALDGQRVGQIVGGQKDMAKGRTFDLPDGSKLSVKLSS